MVQVAIGVGNLKLFHAESPSECNCYVVRAFGGAGDGASRPSE